MDELRATGTATGAARRQDNLISPVSQTPVREFKRAYKACILCRRTKAKCELLPATNGAQPSCVKCRRERRVCEFPATRSTKRRRTTNSDQVRSPPDNDLPANSSNGLATDPEMEQNSQRPMEGDLPNLNQRNANSVQSHSSVEQQGSSHTLQSPANTTSSPASSSTAPKLRRQSMSQTLMRTIVASSNDALGLFFKAVEQPNSSSDQDEPQQDHPNLHVDGVNDDQDSQEPPQHRTPYSTVSGPPISDQLSVVPQEVLQLWNRSRFVKQGWFSAREAVTFVDLFFKNCAQYTPIITDYYASYSNHFTLVTEETLLCCTILSISSRVHILPGLGGIARGHYIHGRLWTHMEHLISRVIFGQEKLSTARTRTLGTIESFLLNTEWHPRSLHFPPQNDGWDVALLAPDAPDAPFVSEGLETEENLAFYRWREEVFEPAKRSDRMSWMLVGAATTLAHELGIFRDQDASASGATESTAVKVRRMRVRMLLYVYVNQLAMRLGSTTLIPEIASHSILDRSSLPPMTREEQKWNSMMGCWFEMTKLMETVTDMFFPSAEVTRQLLLSGRYTGLLKHFKPLLEQCHEQANKIEGLSDSMRDLLFIEYQYIRLYINSIAIQAVVERALAQNISNDTSSSHDGFLLANVSGSDHALNAEVIDACCQILRKMVSLSNAGMLCFAPVRIYMRIISASIFLLKAISLGVGNHDLQVSLGVLDECSHALQNRERLDEMHLSSRYGTLLARHVNRFRRNFVGQVRGNGHLGSSLARQGVGRPAAVQDQASYVAASQGDGSSDVQDFQNMGMTGFDGQSEFRGRDMGEAYDDWLAQPFDPGIAPFELGGPQFQSGFDVGSLNFLWNLPG